MDFQISTSIYINNCKSQNQPWISVEMSEVKLKKLKNIIHRVKLSLSPM